MPGSLGNNRWLRSRTMNEDDTPVLQQLAARERVPLH